MVDKIIRVDPTLHRVQEAGDDQGGGNQQEEYPEEEGRKKKKDKFATSDGPSLKKIVPDTTGRGHGRVRAQLTAGRKPTIPSLLTPSEAADIPSTDTESSSEEVSLSMSQRLLVLWGVIDTKGKLRAPVVVTYILVAAVIVTSVVMILSILWR